MKELRVTAIKEGTVIDHLPSELVFKVVEILELENAEKTVMVASYLKSKKNKNKTKGIVKVAGTELTQEQLNKIAIIAPKATVNIIKNYAVDKKLKLELPDEMVNVLKCSNPKCITNNDKQATKFKVAQKKPVKVQCYYCERFMDHNELEIL